MDSLAAGHGGASPSSPISTPTSRRWRPRWRGSRSSSVDGVYCGGDLVGYGPHPNEVCALIAERGDPDDLRQLRLRDRAATSRTAAAPTSRRTTASSGSDRSTGRWRTPNAASKDFMRALPFDLRFRWARRRCTSSTARRARSTSTCSRTSRPAYTSASRAPRRPACSSSATPTSRGSTSTAASCSSTAARSASPRTAIRAAPSQCSSRRRRWRRGTHRAGRLRRRRGGPRGRGVGAAGEFAEKLVLAA